MERSTVNPFAGPSQVKVMRKRLLQHDLDMYAAISGTKPRVRLPAQPASEMVRVATATKSKPWSPAILGAYLAQLSMPRLSVRAIKPEVTDWVRKLSSQAIDRLAEAQVRLEAARESARRRNRAES